jgi:hypothetical protein
VTLQGFDDLPAADKPRPLGVGIHLGIPPARYHADPCERPALSSSVASLIVARSPAHARLAHPRLGGGVKRDDPTADMDRGTLLHRLILGRGSEVEAVDAKDWRTNAAKDAREAARGAGRIPVLQWKLREAELAAEVLRANMGDAGVELDGESEVVIVWEEKSDRGVPVLCRAMIDHWAAPVEIDLKTTDDASPDACIKKIGPMGYAIQRAAYLSGLEHVFPDLAGRIVQRIVWCEAEAPFCVTPVELSGEFLEYGRRRWRRAVNRWAECLESGEWPGYTRGVIRAEPPPWLLSQDLDEGIRNMGALDDANQP